MHSVLICKISKRRVVGERSALPSLALGGSYPFIGIQTLAALSDANVACPV